MKVKSSNSASYILISSLILMIFILIFYGNPPVYQTTNIDKDEVEYFSVPQTTTLNFIEINLSEKNYNKLKKYRDKALSVGVISAKEKKYVSATLRYNGKKHKADIRLKGDWIDHLIGDKWSFRIKLKGDKTIQGMKKFSIHHPITRGYINEWVYQKTNKKEGLIGLRYGFVEGAINIKKDDKSGYIKKNLGVYAIEETFDKRLLENNKRKESVILKFSEENWWSDVKKRITVGEKFGLRWDKFKSKKEGPWKYPVRVFSESKVLEDSLLSSYFDLSKNILEGFRKNNYRISQVFNTKQLAMHNALSNLFGAFHGGYIINLRFYYNPITSKLEPISFDGNSGQEIDKYHHFLFANKKRDTLYFQELIKALEKVSKKDYLNAILRSNKKETNYFNLLLKKEFDSKNLNISKSILSKNQEVLRKEIAKLKLLFPILSASNNETINIKPSNYSKWKLSNIDLLPSTKTYKGDTIFNLKRIDTSRISYGITKYENIDLAQDYATSFIVKASKNSHLFAIRIQGEYPSRVDAVFDVLKGTVKGVENTEGFNDGSATIKKLSDGWYQCSLKVKPKTNSFKVIIGIANPNSTTLYWESKSEINNAVFIAL